MQRSRAPGRRRVAPRGPAAVLLRLVALFVMTAAGCGQPETAPRLILIGVDGADWGILRPMAEAGELPHFRRLMEEGTAARLWSLQPIISPVIWTTLATGKGPDKHGILDFTMPDPGTGEPIVISSGMRRSKAFWNILSEAGYRVCVVGWWASWPAEEIRGTIVSDRVGQHAFLANPEADAGLVSPAELSDEVLSLRGSLDEIGWETTRRFLQISREDLDAAPEVDFQDPISHFRHIYRTMTDYAEISLHLLRTQRPEVLAVYFEGIDSAAHMYMRYAPPAYPGTTEREREAYGDAVRAFYRYQDEILGRILEHADETTTVAVVSDHGFLQGHQRPVEDAADVDYATAARWHRLEGVLILRGPDVPAGRWYLTESPAARATVFDITPTILALLGESPARDMDGRVLLELLSDQFEPQAPVTTYDDARWKMARAEAARNLQAIDPETRERLRSLGYIGAHETDESLSLRAQWGLAEYLIFRGRLDEAQSELEDLRRRAPSWPEPPYHLGLVQIRQGRMEEAEGLFRASLELDPKKLEARQNLAFILRQRGDLEEARALLLQGAENHPHHLGVRLNLGMLCREMGDPASSLEHLREAVRLNPESHAAHAQSALTLEALGREEAAAEHWRDALRLQPNDPVARDHLDQILGAEGETDS